MDWIIVISLLLIIGGLSRILDSVLLESTIKEIKDYLIEFWIKIQKTDFRQVLI